MTAVTLAQLPSTWARGQSYTIAWSDESYSDNSTVTLRFQFGEAGGSEHVMTIASNVVSPVHFVVPDSATLQTSYTVRLASSDNPFAYNEWTPSNYSIINPAGSSTPCFDIFCQNGGICEAGECRCHPNYSGVLCHLPTTANIRAFELVPQAYSLAAQIDTTAAASIDDCAHRCLANLQCTGFNYGREWTDFKDTCTLLQNTSGNLLLTMTSSLVCRC